MFWSIVLSAARQTIKATSLTVRSLSHIPDVWAFLLLVAVNSWVVLPIFSYVSMY